MRVEELDIWIVLKQEININSFINRIEKDVLSNFIEADLYRKYHEKKLIDAGELKTKDGFQNLYGYYRNNIIDFYFQAKAGKIISRIVSSFVTTNIDETYILYEQVRELIFKMYDITDPLFIRTAHIDGAGDVHNEELIYKQIFSIHWMQIFSKEMLQSINVEKLKKSDKFYKVEELGDGAIFIQITEEPTDTYKIIKELSDEIEIKCPEKYRWWEPKY